MTLCEAWATVDDLEQCYTPPEDTPAELIAAKLEQASELLFAFTGRQYPGECTETIRPCSVPGGGVVDPYQWSFPWIPIRSGGQWLNLGGCAGCHTASDCACTPYPSVNLGRSDVTLIEEVLIDGDVLDPTAYRIDNRRTLVRDDGSGWPCCQRLDRPSGEPGTWSIELVYGDPVPSDLVVAAAVLASEFIKACVGDGTCQLPQRTQSIQRQGLNIALLDPFDFLESGRTGLYQVDAAIVAHNPNGLTQPSQVWSFDTTPRGPRVP